MRKNKATFIPTTKNAAKPTIIPPGTQMGQPRTIDQLVNEGHADIRQMTGAQVRLGNLLDTLVNEIVVREQELVKLRAASEAAKA